MLWQTLLIETQLLARAVDSMMSPAPVRKSAAAEFLTGLAVVLACLGGVAVAAGTYLWLAETHTLRDTILIMGSLGLAAGMIAGCAAWAAANTRRIKLKIAEKVVGRKVQTFLEAVVEEFSEPVREYPKTATALAALAGVVVGEKLGKEAARDLHAAFVPHINIPTDEIEKTIEKSIEKSLH